MGVPRACYVLFSLLSCTSYVIVLFNVPYYWTFHSVVGFIICGHNIKFTIAEVVKLFHIVQIKHNEVVDYIIQYAEHRTWHVRTCTKLGYRCPGLYLTCLR
jgi:hypothetical protein